MKKEVGREEARRRQAAARSRRAGRKGEGARGFDPEDEDALAFEKLRRHRGPIGSASPAPTDPFSGDPLADLPHEGVRKALVVGVHRSAIEVSLESGRHRIERDARTEGIVVGDEVLLREAEGLFPGRVVGLEPRRSLLARPDPADPRRTRAIAANLDLGVIVLAAPASGRLRTGLVDRAWLALDEGGVAPLVVVNKVDRLDEGAASPLAESLAPYRSAGIPCLEVSALRGGGLGELLAIVREKTIVLLGPSGVGKSTLANALEGRERRSTRSVRAGDDKGRHTTTASNLVVLPDGTRLIDTPGIRAFGALAVSETAIARAFPEITEAAFRCRYRDCRHAAEDDCAVRLALEEGAITSERLERWRRILAESRENREGL